jgi:hypothetical protein
VSPTTATLYGGQTQQLAATVINTSNTGVTWTISPAGTGTVSASGLYTAPASITSQQTVTITATSLTDMTQAASATVTLMMPVSVGVTPPSATIGASQTQQFTASVLNTGNTAVTWTISPAGTGTINASGLYTAPASISTPQTVTITATSQADTTESASATITLSPTQCGSSAYSYERAIVIHHSQVPNSDQQNFPFLFNTTDPLLKSTANGGHVNSPSGYDVTFATDAACTAKLNDEIEAWNGLTGQCGSSGFSSQRTIVIDHTKVPNTDQANFPFLFNTTDPDLATIGNGGHVTNANGYDIIFSTDPNGLTKLDHEVEQ